MANSYAMYAYCTYNVNVAELYTYVFGTCTAPVNIAHAYGTERFLKF
jgi:hypothetical protein